ncbi:MAG: HtaA domain-containing protein [Acidimicrobiia bacterium]
MHATALTDGQPAARRSVRSLAAVVVGALALGVLLVPGAGAATKKSTTTKATAGTLTWTVSQYVNGANPAVSSLSEARTAEPPATFNATSGWTFSDGTGTFDTKTNAATVSFKGALMFGNTNSGNYAFKYANPVVTLDATGAGTLTAEVSSRPAGGAAFGTATRITVVDITGAAPTTTKKNTTTKHVEVTAAPTVFSDAIITAAADLGAFFKATGSSNDAIKPPTPITLAFDYKVKKS